MSATLGGMMGRRSGDEAGEGSIKRDKEKK